MVAFCENGAKAVNWEATKRRVDAAFFAKHSVTALLEQSDYWLEYQGRLTEPMRYDAETDRYHTRQLGSSLRPHRPAPQRTAKPGSRPSSTPRAGPATRRRTCISCSCAPTAPTTFRICSNMCHEASGVALAQSVGVGKGTVTFDDFEHADAIFVWGQNPGTNHPRMLEPLREAVKRGAQVVCINPLKERGLERFQHPQHPLEMLTNGDKPTNTAYFRPALGGDMAILRGMAKFLLQWERHAPKAGEPPCSITTSSTNTAPTCSITWASHRRHLVGMKSSRSPACPWWRSSRPARMYAKGKNVIMCWAMGITQHRHSVPTIQEIANLMLLRGNIGRPAPVCARCAATATCRATGTMGINERPPVAFLDALERRFQFQVPRTNGHNVVEAIHAMARRPRQSTLSPWAAIRPSYAGQPAHLRSPE